MEKEIVLRTAAVDDAPYIAEGIMMALGDEMVHEMANGRGTAAVKEIFTRLARMEDSQYSYRNSIVAATTEGEVAGIVVAYDGEILIEARRKFFALTQELLGWDIHEFAEDGEPEVETDPSEYYLDSLAVWPDFRGCGIATALIHAVEEKARAAGKPVGLLCTEHNNHARRLYESLGFRQVGYRPFAGEMMAHMVNQLSQAKVEV